MAIKKLSGGHNALKNGKAIHGVSLFPAEEMESCIKGRAADRLLDQKTVPPIEAVVDLLLSEL
jgi:hypothetical protein